MNALALNVMLALIWAAGTGEFTLTNLAIGFALGYIVLRVIRLAIGEEHYFLKVRRTITFVGFYLVELVKANLRVARDVLTIDFKMRPGIVAVPLDCSTDEEITLFANLLSLTPGTLSIDVSEDRKFLYVHALYVEDRESFQREVKEGIERRVLELFR
jgi:multicomponent Na+:H+ antiporter subunit E